MATGRKQLGQTRQDGRPKEDKELFALFKVAYSLWILLSQVKNQRQEEAGGQEGAKEFKLVYTVMLSFSI